MSPPATRGGIADRKRRARIEWINENAEARSCKPTLQHWLTGECAATRGLWGSEKGAAHVAHLESATKICKQARRDAHENGREVGKKAIQTLEKAEKAARAAHQGEHVDAQGWNNRYAVLAGCLPAWADDNEGSKGRHTKAVIQAVMHGQDLAKQAAEAWREAAAPARQWLRHRIDNRGLMTLVFRSWRERVEHDTPGINNDNTRWRIRRAARTRNSPRRAPRRRGGAMVTHESVEKKFANERLNDVERFAEGYKWSPWRDDSQRIAIDGNHDEAVQRVDETLLTQWRMKSSLMRLATYYRVTGAHERAMRRRRTENTKTRFRAWAISVLNERRMTRTNGDTATTSQQLNTSQQVRRTQPQRHRPSAQHATANTDRKRRATAAQMAERRLQPQRRRRMPTATCTELGKRMRDEMNDVANECMRIRRLRHGDG